MSLKFPRCVTIRSVVARPFTWLVALWTLSVGSGDLFGYRHEPPELSAYPQSAFVIGLYYMVGSALLMTALLLSEQRLSEAVEKAAMWLFIGGGVATSVVYFVSDFSPVSAVQALLFAAACGVRLYALLRRGDCEQ